ncbi:MAG: ammonium transporter [Dehalococcoidales bacterium]|nr:ammonium transporter [Dehalococcoidales bacterium]MDP7109406.1 ammonium transporter [Dehalococcoidales bacterium]MDP7309739.1 ammonium transporter [Dehalococcoidales bacterium]MDP7409328.1 ammonium transporter [Dehalococcoidales bacterium]MDP7675663.1 ammonium transporter [Dehalococcoidales bacterium]|tara:strand:- start:2039 stop:3253 length:1215 start_codon:yes stop_codon:yes gene_type:complete
MDTGNTAWVLASSAMVLLMTPGLAFFYGGLARSKNVGATIMHSFIAIGVVSVVWVLWGYTLAFGGDVGGFIGNLDYLGLAGVSAFESTLGYTISDQTFMIFQAMFAIITPALITGAFAERMKFSTFLVFIVLWVTIVYAPVAHWVWGGGWLGGLGALDFAGGTVVHINSGVAALAAALIFGRRLGFKREPMEPHNIPFVVLGAGLLWFGWFGFNAGSALAADGTAVNAFVVTNTAAGAGAVTWTLMSWIFGTKPSVVGAASGAVAGLVAITPAAGFVGPIPAIIIGLGAGILCYGAVQLLVKLNVDDALAVCGVHGVGGTWGALATGLFVGIGFSSFGDLAGAASRGEQILAQLIGIGATVVWAFVTTAIILYVLKATMGLRVSKEEEEAGLDVSQHAERAYRL